MKPRTPLLPTALLISGLATAGNIENPVLQVIYADPPGSGFHDSTPATPVPGNDATTLGGQRRAAMQAAADMWATRIDSEVPIRIHARFRDLGCGAEGVAGTGQTWSSFRNFPNAPLPDTDYPSALASALAGEQLGDNEAEIRVAFNARLDADSECNPFIPDGFWYGLDHETPFAPGTVPFLSMAQHEIGHGLGFQTLVDLDTGRFSGEPPRPDIYSTHLYSVSRDRYWPELTPEQRLASIADEDDLVWAGDRLNERASDFLLPPARIRVDPPVQGESTFPAFLQAYPPHPEPAGLGGPFLVADSPTDRDSDDEVPRRPSDACEPLPETPSPDGAIVLATRGGCPVERKWQNVFDAGAIALVLADHVAPGEPASIARDFFLGPSIRLPIPLWSVSDAVGDALLSAPPERITLGYDQSRDPHGTVDGMVLMESGAEPGGVGNGVNLSHFSGSLIPISLMSPVSPWLTMFNDLDIAPALLADLGWPDADAKKGQFTGSWFNRDRSGEGCLLTLEGDGDTLVLTCYLYESGQQVWLLGSTRGIEGSIDFDNVIVSRGADYGSAFDPEDVEIIDWGRIRMQAVDCNNAWFDLMPERDDLPAFRVLMTKIVPGDCQASAGRQPDRRLSGNFYDPERDGEGIQLVQESDGETVTLAWYTYLDGTQLWVTGAETRDGDRLVFDDLVTTQGADYGRAFDPEDLGISAFGTIELDLLGCNEVRVKIDPDFGGLETSEHMFTRVVERDC